MSNGLYKGLENGLLKGEFNGLEDGCKNGMFDNETFIKKKVIQEGLQLYLDFSNPRCYNYGRGQIGDKVYNLVNNNKNFTIGNLTGRTTANAPYVEYNPIPAWNNYTLNGTGQNYLTSPNNTDFDIGLNGLTVSMWVNMSVLTSAGYFMGKSLAGGVVGRWSFYTISNQIQFLVHTATGGYNIAFSPPDLILNKWQYITVVFNRTTGIVNYIDNVVCIRFPLNTVGENLTVNRPFRIGSHSDNILDAGARCKINYITLYNRALTEAELTYNYNITKQFMRL